MRKVWQENWLIFKKHWKDKEEDGMDWYYEFMESMVASMNLLERNEKNK